MAAPRPQLRADQAAFMAVHDPDREAYFIVFDIDLQDPTQATAYVADVAAEIAKSIPSAVFRGDYEGGFYCGVPKGFEISKMKKLGYFLTVLSIPEASFAERMEEMEEHHMEQQYAEFWRRRVQRTRRTINSYYGSAALMAIVSFVLTSRNGWVCASCGFSGHRHLECKPRELRRKREVIR